MSKFKKFKAWAPWNVATLVFCFIVFGVVPFAVAVASDSVQGTVTGVAVAVGGTFACVRYFSWRQEYARQHVFYSTAWGCNVWCTGPRALERWNFGVSKFLTDAMTEVSSKFEDDAHVYLEGLRFEIVDKPFPLGSGLASGAYYPSSHLIRMVWSEGNNWPSTLHHELLHVIVAQRDGLDGNEATHKRMHELAEQGVVPRSWA